MDTHSFSHIYTGSLFLSGKKDRIYSNFFFSKSKNNGALLDAKFEDDNINNRRHKFIKKEESCSISFLCTSLLFPEKKEEDVHF